MNILMIIGGIVLSGVAGWVAALSAQDNHKGLYAALIGIIGGFIMGLAAGSF